MQILSEKRQQILQIAQAKWQRANLHQSMLDWRPEAIESFGFEDGTGQWNTNDIATVTARGQIPLVSNRIQPIINAISGVEIQSRYRIAVQNDSGNYQDDRLAKALTHFLYHIQKNQKVPHKGSLKFRNMLICGIGWSNIYKEDGRIFYEEVHPFNVMPDPDDLTEQYTSMRYVCRKRWLDPKVVRKLWPKVAQYINFEDPDLCQIVYSPELIDRSSGYTNMQNYTGYNQSRVLVCEVQHKEQKLAFRGIDSQGYYFETFNEELAEEIANSKKDIEDFKAEQIIRTLFLDNFLLESAPLNPSIPNMQDFSYIPCVWKRRFKTGVPYGLVHPMKDIQRDLNVRLTKALYMLNSKTLIMQGNKTLEYKDAFGISQQLKRPDPVLMLPSDITKWDYRENAPLTEAHIKLIERYDIEFQKVTGFFDESLGAETNANSGIAQKQRHLGSIRNNVFAFDNFSDMKEREAKVMLDLIQGSGDENILAQILTPDEREDIILNMTKVIKGKKYVFNDIRTLPISLYIEEVPDFNSSKEERKATIDNLLANPNAMFIMQSPGLMKLLGIREYEEIAEEMKNAVQGQNANNLNLQSVSNNTNTSNINNNVGLPNG